MSNGGWVSVSIYVLLQTISTWHPGELRSTRTPLSISNLLSIMVHAALEVWKTQILYIYIYIYIHQQSFNGHSAHAQIGNCHSGRKVLEFRKFRTSSSSAASRARSPGLRASAWMAEDDGAPMSGFRSAWHTVSRAGRSPFWK